jgi:hypothetical protein
MSLIVSAALIVARKPLFAAKAVTGCLVIMSNTRIHETTKFSTADRVTNIALRNVWHPAAIGWVDQYVLISERTKSHATSVSAPSIATSGKYGGLTIGV